MRALAPVHGADDEAERDGEGEAHGVVEGRAPVRQVEACLRKQHNPQPQQEKVWALSAS